MAEVAERSTVEVLKAARERISNPQRWTQSTFARDRKGDKVPPGSRYAACWCAAGAVRAEVEDVYHGVGRRARDFLRSAAVEKVGTPHDSAVPRFNDLSVRRHRDVLALYDRAIQLAEQEAK